MTMERTHSPWQKNKQVQSQARGPRPAGRGHYLRLQHRLGGVQGVSLSSTARSTGNLCHGGAVWGEAVSCGWQELKGGTRAPGIAGVRTPFTLRLVSIFQSL